MPVVRFHTLTLQKLYPLAISRGAMASSDNLFVTVESDGIVGIGELSPATGSAWTAARGEAQLAEFAETWASDPQFLVPSVTYARMREASMDPPAMAALDVAIWDYLAKRAGMPLSRMLGLSATSVPTSVTVGINPPEVTRERVPELLARTGARFLKVKLGSPDGREHDQAHFEAACEAAAPFQPVLRVDANGGWTVEETQRMIPWLQERRVEYVEQPLAQGLEGELPHVFAGRALPIYVDESIRFASDIPPLAAVVDGINLKLMKCGGITEALRIVATARAHGLKTMIGCMSESSIAIAAGASIGSLFDSIDLDSHLNLNPDPAEGAPIAAGVVTPIARPGHGGRLREDWAHA